MTKAAAEGIALGVIYSADGAGNVKNCLTDNAELLGIDKTKVTDEFAESIIGKKFDAVSKIGIDSFVPDEKPIQGGGSKGSSSKGGISNSGISGVTVPTAEPIDKSTKEFTDLDGFEWAQNAINTLRTEGIFKRQVGRNFCSVRACFERGIFENAPFGGYVRGA
ncbi:MAG: hypothetical protein L6V93_17620 [Clostridiales bacterium]|nr:MAG: hypothetical protein L6V93_17620 [Clostridiales bacterium]